MARHWVTKDHICKWCGQNLLSPHTTSECPSDRRKQSDEIVCPRCFKSRERQVAICPTCRDK